MTNTLAERFHLIATHVDDLTDSGKVRAMTGNEKGYAKVHEVTRGCKVWAHHTRDDRLFIDLMVTKSSALSEPTIGHLAKTAFEQVANKYGYQVTSRVWQHSINAGDTRQQHYIDVTDKSTESAITLINAIRATFEELLLMPSVN